jgi:hypothetical protein
MLIRISRPDGTLLWEGRWGPRMSFTLRTNEDGVLYLDHTSNIQGGIWPPWKVEITPISPTAP